MTLLGVATGLLLASCGETKTSSISSSSTSAAAGSCDVQVTGAAGTKPAVTVPRCAAPATLQVKDLTVGTGAAVKAGDTAVVQYTLYGWEGKTLVQSSYDAGQPFPVQDVGHAAVIPGWNQGLIGLKHGGRRLLVIPAGLGYGDQGTPDGSIKPGEALVFVIDALQVVPPR